jgi:hypothetical protein
MEVSIATLLNSVPSYSELNWEPGSGFIISSLTEILPLCLVSSCLPSFFPFCLPFSFFSPSIFFLLQRAAKNLWMLRRSQRQIRQRFCHWDPQYKGHRFIRSNDNIVSIQNVHMSCVPLFLVPKFYLSLCPVRLSVHLRSLSWSFPFLSLHVLSWR